MFSAREWRVSLVFVLVLPHPCLHGSIGIGVVVLDLKSIHRLKSFRGRLFKNDPCYVTLVPGFTSSVRVFSALCAERGGFRIQLAWGVAYVERLTYPGLCEYTCVAVAIHK